MKYSSHEGRWGNFSAACAIRSIGLAGRSMKLPGTLDSPAGPRQPSSRPMRRILQPELLDSLAPQDPEALHSRRDLRLTNKIMGNHRWLAHSLRSLVQPGETALELGAGTAELNERLRSDGISADAI